MLYFGAEIGQSAKGRLAGTTTKVLDFGTSSDKHVPDTVSDLEQQSQPIAIPIQHIPYLIWSNVIKFAIPIQQVSHQVYCHLFCYYQNATSSPLNLRSHIQRNTYEELVMVSSVRNTSKIFSRLNRSNLYIIITKIFTSFRQSGYEVQKKSSTTYETNKLRSTRECENIHGIPYISSILELIYARRTLCAQIFARIYFLQFDI